MDGIQIPPDVVLLEGLDCEMDSSANGYTADASLAHSKKGGHRAYAPLGTNSERIAGGIDDADMKNDTFSGMLPSGGCPTPTPTLPLTLTLTLTLNLLLLLLL